MAFSEDGGTVYAAGKHVPLQRYVIEAERVAERVCSRTRGTLTREQWRTYASDVPYRRVCAG